MPIAPSPSCLRGRYRRCLIRRARPGRNRGRRDGSDGAPAGAMPGSFTAGVLRVVDGDTLEARVAVWPGQEIVILVRLAGVDAPELDGRCAAERRAAAAAREALSRLVGNGAVVLSDVRPDKYFGRVVARVAGADGRDFGQVLGEAGHVRPYEGGRRLSWCEAGPAAAGKAAPARKHDSLSAQRL